MVLTLPATLTYRQALVARQALNAQITVQPAVVIDASGLMQFDSSTLAVMLACRRQAIAAGKTFAIQGLPEKLVQLAGLYGVAELLCPSVQGAGFQVMQ